MKHLHFFNHRNYFIILLLLCTAGAVFGQSTGQLKGKIMNTEGQPLSGINVSLLGTSFGDATNLAGSYSILNILAGEYTLFISGIGFERA